MAPVHCLQCSTTCSTHASGRPTGCVQSLVWQQGCHPNAVRPTHGTAVDMHLPAWLASQLCSSTSACQLECCRHRVPGSTPWQLCKYILLTRAAAGEVAGYSRIRQWGTYTGQCPGFPLLPSPSSQPPHRRRCATALQGTLRCWPGLPPAMAPGIRGSGSGATPWLHP